MLETPTQLSTTSPSSASVSLSIAAIRLHYVKHLPGTMAAYVGSQVTCPDLLTHSRIKPGEFSIMFLTPAAPSVADASIFDWVATTGKFL